MPREPRLGLPDLGVGVGLRVPHYAHVFSHRPPMDWFEVVSENFMVSGGRPLANLDRALSGYPIVLHGVSLGIGNARPLDREHLASLRALVRRTRSPWVSDHLCWTGADDAHLHELLPLPYTEEALAHVVERARQVQDALGVRLLLENVSSYLTYRDSSMTEAAFLRAVAEQADIGILLDVNNVFVSATNHGFDPLDYLRALPHERVVQIHLAGHTESGSMLIDTHSARVSEPVWELYREACRLCGPVSTLIEWDADLPSFEVLAAEAARAVRERKATLAASSAPTASRPSAESRR